MAADKEIRRTGWRELFGIGLLTIGVLMGLAFFSYDPGDINILRAPAYDPPMNYIGPLGAWFAFVSLMLFGAGALLIPPLCGAIGVFLLLQQEENIGYRPLGALVLLIVVGGLLALHPTGWGALAARFNISDIVGGMLGWLVGAVWLSAWIGVTGATIVLAGLLCGALVMSVGRRRLLGMLRVLPASCGALRGWINARLHARRDRLDAILQEERDLARRIAAQEKAVRREQRATRENRAAELPMPESPAPELSALSAGQAESESPVVPARAASSRSAARPARSERASAVVEALPVHNDNYRLPPIELLQPVPAEKSRDIEGDFQTTAKVLVETLADFGIECEATNVERGPVVTQYELKPAAGIRVERIAQLSNNLALTLKATSVRVQAPIPGKGVVGIEVPNSTAKRVYLREILESKTWQNQKAAVPLVLGQDVAGNNMVADLATMPHLLIAGATGSGKTVCMNSILAGMLMSKTPNQLKLLLVDPKRVEFSAYADLPHLVTPVIVESKRVPLGLRWAINEMENRYKMFAKVGVRNILGYNSRPIEQKLPAVDVAAAGENDNAPPDRLPYIVIVIDELADLMLVAQADVENSIARLAQMSRAVGIHMILATQRPSVNVITGTIKANFPARISFQVAQKVDSRTILDTIGADKLLGRGDMLILPPGSSKLVRAQGAMTTDDDIAAIVEFWKKQGAPAYEMALKASLENPSVSFDGDDGGADEEMLQAAIGIIRETQRASVSLLQRRLKIGYNRAGRLMDQLEDRGVVGPAHGSDPREILIDLDGEIPVNALDQGSEV